MGTASALGILNNYLKKINIKNSLVFSGSYETSLNTSPPPKLLSLHCKQINGVKNEVNGQPSSLLTGMYVSDHKAAFSSMPQTYRLKKLTEIEVYLLDEIKDPGRLAKK